MKIHLIGRHQENFFPDYIQVMRQTNKLFTSIKDAEDFISEIVKEARENDWHIVFQNCPSYLAIALSWYHHKNIAIPQKQVKIGFVVGKQSELAREPKVAYFQTSEPNIIWQSVIFSNPKANCTLVGDAEVKVEISEPLVKFEFDKIVWL